MIYLFFNWNTEQWRRNDGTMAMFVGMFAMTDHDSILKIPKYHFISFYHSLAI